MNSATVGELPGRADQLAQVLQPARGLDGVLGLQLGQVAAGLERGLEQVAGTFGDERRQLVEQLDEGRDAPGRGARDPDLVGPPQRLREGDALGGGEARRAGPTVVSPTPRLGTLSTRLTLTSSAGLTTARR